VADVQESILFVRYKWMENQLIIFADGINPRYVTTMCLLDYDTAAVADKFGNISVMRLPHQTSDVGDVDPTGNRCSGRDLDRTLSEVS